jgi:hypothetical protein
LAQTNDGTYAQDEFVRLMTRPGRHVWRLRDKKDLMGLNRGKKVAAFAVPSDFLVGEADRVYFAEVKSTVGDRFEYSNVQPGQRSASGISAAIGSPYWFFIYSLKLEQWFQLPASQFHADIKAGKKSRSLQELDPCSMM